MLAHDIDGFLNEAIVYMGLGPRGRDGKKTTYASCIIIHTWLVVSSSNLIEAIRGYHPTSK